jgi:hypothetical protein
MLITLAFTVLFVAGVAGSWWLLWSSHGRHDLLRSGLIGQIAVTAAAGVAALGFWIGLPEVWIAVFAVAGAGVATAIHVFAVSARTQGAGGAGLFPAIGLAAVAGLVAASPGLLSDDVGPWTAVIGAAVAAVMLATEAGFFARRRQPSEHEQELGYEHEHDGRVATETFALPAALSAAAATAHVAAPMVGSLAVVAGTIASVVLSPLEMTQLPTDLSWRQVIDLEFFGQHARMSPTSPVYNAIAQPSGGAADVLLDGVRTRIFFSIGPRDSRNMIADPSIAERRLAELNRQDAVDLAVTMTCHVCDDTLPQVGMVRYVARLRSSTIASFDVLPSRVAAERRQGTSITFSLDRDGDEFDFLKLAVRVEREPVSTPAPPTAGPACRPPTLVRRDSSDLVIRVARTNEALVVGFSAPDPELANRLAALGISRPDGTPQFFRTGAATPDVVAMTAAETYASLKTLVEQNEGLRKALPAIPALEPRVQSVFDAPSRQKAIDALYDLGADMYDTLFYSGEAALTPILRAIESYGDEKPNLRILVYTSSTYLPWQLLHAKTPDGTAPDGGGFWGNKFLLGVLPVDEERGCGPLPDAMPAAATDSTLYAHYWQPAEAGSDAEDTVSRLGALFGRQMSSALGDKVEVVRTKEDFTASLKRAHRQLLVIWSFTHGHSGDVIGSVAGQPALTPTVTGQRLDFSRTSSLRAMELKRLTSDSSGNYFFSARPFVFLNGCETGTQGTRGTNDLSLPGIFLLRGARGVVATEAPVWDAFAFNFALIFLEKLKAGAPASQAMLETRRQFLSEGNNPLGLLYSYYGNGGVRLQRPG